jgi:hypothetical protein
LAEAAFRVDPRLRRAVDASIGWYEDIFALHGIGSVLEDGLWSSLAPPPPLHSDAVTVEPTVRAEQVVERLDGRPRAGVKDSFATLDLSAAGMEVLFSATWMHRDPAIERPTPWRGVRDAEGLAAWNAGWDTAEVLLPALLGRAHIRVLERVDGDEVTAGAIARLGSGAVDVSNVHGVGGHAVDWAELATAIAALFPGRPVVGYERGADLEAAISGGFDPVGELRVWVR